MAVSACRYYSYDMTIYLADNKESILLYVKITDSHPNYTVSRKVVRKTHDDWLHN